MADYIKSHSNYVIKKQHQTVNDGTIYERDITTIGGVDSFAKGQTPYYQSGNFIITVNDGVSYSKKFSPKSWVSNEVSGDVWTVDSITDKDTSGSTNAITLKQDVYKLTTYAYYGSCVELVRGSITNIISNFPGELYSPIVTPDLTDSGREEGVKVYYSVTDEPTYVEGEGGSIEKIGTSKSPSFKRLGGDNTNLYLLDNPFGLDIYSQDHSESEVENSLKYFAYDNFMKYHILYNNNDYNEITQWNVSLYGDCDEFRRIAKVSVAAHSTYSNINLGFSIYVMLGDNGNIVYLTDKLGLHIRPKEEYINKFFNGLKNFEKLLLNRESTPLYTASFEILHESETGFDSLLQDFTFPTTYGDYNLDTKTDAFQNYIQELSDVGEFYDEYFCDNIWRSMTHEAIKNFDWTYEREYSQGDEAKYVEGGTKMQKLIRLFGREFDEIKQYIDALAYMHTVAYNDLNSMANYFLTDAVNVDGWDANNVYPLIIEGDTTHFSSVTEDIESVIQPYGYEGDTTLSKYKKYWINLKACNDCEYCTNEVNTANWSKSECDATKTVETLIPSLTRETSGTTAQYHLDETHVLRQTIAPYISSSNYTMKEVNDYFMKMLKINSRSILVNKGTINGLEMILGLFGYESINHLENSNTYQTEFVEEYNNEHDSKIVRYTDLDDDEYKKDYLSTYLINNQKSVCEIVEETVFTRGLNDYWLPAKGRFAVDWANSTKYSHDDADEFYQGLPLKAIQLLSTTEAGDIAWGNNMLYPYIDKSNTYDMDIVYQSNGGWQMHYPIMFSQKNYILELDNTTNGSWTDFFTETLVKTHYVETIQDLISLDVANLANGDIYYVNNLTQDYLIVDGVLYNIYSEVLGDEEFLYISVKTYGSQITVGNVTFTDDVTVSNPYYSNYNYRHFISDYDDNVEIKIYLKWLDDSNTFTIEAYNDYESINNVSLFTNKNMYGITGDTSTITKYFKLSNVDFKYELSPEGWSQIRTTDEDYRYIDLYDEVFKGNNPHTSHPSYDNGADYMITYQSLFHYYLDNGEINSNCFTQSDEYDATLEEMANLGFHDFASDISTLECDHKYTTYEDNKIHYFGDLLVLTDECDSTSGKRWCYQRYDTEFENNPFLVLDKTRQSISNFYDLFNYSENQYNKGLKYLYDYASIGEDEQYQLEDTMLSSNKYLHVEAMQVNGVQEQIINTKIIKVTFFLHATSKLEKYKEIKYIDSVILPYVSQMIPSTAIFKVFYRNFDEEVQSPKKSASNVIQATTSINNNVQTYKIAEKQTNNTIKEYTTLQSLVRNGGTVVLPYSGVSALAGTSSLSGKTYYSGNTYYSGITYYSGSTYDSGH